MIDPAIFATMSAQFVGDPTIRRLGMLLFREGKLGIVAHIVEGGGLAKAANALAMGTNPVAATVSAVAQVVQLVQN